jgi:hypothetical protein
LLQQLHCESDCAKERIFGCGWLSLFKEFEGSPLPIDSTAIATLPARTRISPYLRGNDSPLTVLMSVWYFPARISGVW